MARRRRAFIPSIKRDDADDEDDGDNDDDDDDGGGSGGGNSPLQMTLEPVPIKPGVVLSSLLPTCRRHNASWEGWACSG